MRRIRGCEHFRVTDDSGTVASGTSVTDDNGTVVISDGTSPTDDSGTATASNTTVYPRGDGDLLPADSS